MVNVKIRKGNSTPVKDIGRGVPFRLLNKLQGCVCVKASGSVRGSNVTSEICVVVIADEDEAGGSGSYIPSGHLEWVSPNEPAIKLVQVSPLEFRDA